MIKVVEFFRRRGDLAPEAFLTHWRERHTGFVLALDGLAGYVQNPVIGLAGLPVAPFDGVVEAWFDSLEIMRANARNPHWESLVDDEARFIDRASRLMLLAEAASVALGAGPAKLMLAVERRNGLEVAEFHAGLPGALAPLRSVARALTCDVAIPSSYDKPRALAGDAVVSLFFDTWRDAEETIVGEGLAAPGRLADLASIRTCLAVAERIVRA